MTAPGRGVFIVTGIQGAGKSTVGRLLASRFTPGAFVEGDDLAQMVVGGRTPMSANPGAEAVRQLNLRYRHGALLADSFWRSGFTVVHSDNIYRQDLVRQVRRVRARPLMVVVLTPRSEVVIARERERGGSAYRAWMADDDGLAAAVEEFQGFLQATPRIGLWLDTSDQTADETVAEVLARAEEARVD